ncbi:MAG: deoxyribose-phosphate aldolase [Acidimicrobiales bacterium]|jgi:deoxyribose-phosphate aldolase
MSAAIRVIPTELTVRDIAALIDHSLLRPELTDDDVRNGCALADRYGTWSVCVRPADVTLAAGLFALTNVTVGTVVGFPHGHSTTEAKLFETRRAIDDGAREIDMVINIGAFRSGQYGYVEDEVAEVVAVAHSANALVKVILENAYLSDEQIVEGSRLGERAGAEFIKTSTGFAPKGATVHHLLLMAGATSPKVQIKAAGGVRTLDRLLELVAIGVTRFGATATAAILDEAAVRSADSGAVPVPGPPRDEGASQPTSPPSR